jgi:hypothetical protein
MGSNLLKTPQAELHLETFSWHEWAEHVLPVGIVLGNSWSEAPSRLRARTRSVLLDHQLHKKRLGQELGCGNGTLSLGLHRTQFKLEASAALFSYPW